MSVFIESSVSLSPSSVGLIGTSTQTGLIEEGLALAEDEEEPQP